MSKDGKTLVMPPKKRKKLDPEEIARIKAWIDAGAKPPAAAIVVKELNVPEIKPKVTPRNPDQRDRTYSQFLVHRVGALWRSSVVFVGKWLIGADVVGTSWQR